MDVLVPEFGESVREALVGEWFKKNGERVAKDDPLCELETDKITLDLHADAAGVLIILAESGTTLPIGSKIAVITEDSAVMSNPGGASLMTNTAVIPQAGSNETVSSPSIRLALRENHIDPATIAPTGKDGRITLDDLFTRIEDKSRAVASAGVDSHDHKQKLDLDTLLTAVSSAATQTISSGSPRPGFLHQESVATPRQVSSDIAPAVHSEEPPTYSVQREERVPLSPIRKKIAERLLAARQQTAMLTTFNEVDMSQVIGIRENYRNLFLQRYGVALGLMPFFVKACCQALHQVPHLNASIDGDQIVYHHFYDIGIAIGAEKGLVVPVLRNADSLQLHEIDAAIARFREKISTHQLSIGDLAGGTFTISNGGVYGSMLSTPILNPPQSGVLGMHAIQDRAVVRDGQIVIRPMMYLALSYDHRLVDGRDAVTFLKTVKEYLEDPKVLLPEG